MRIRRAGPAEGGAGAVGAGSLSARGGPGRVLPLCLLRPGPASLQPDLQQRLASSLSGTYSVERELGGGGMSRVFVAEETALGRRVVVKVLAPGVAGALSGERFVPEI